MVIDPIEIWINEDTIAPVDLEDLSDDAKRKRRADLNTVETQVPTAYGPAGRLDLY